MNATGASVRGLSVDFAGLPGVHGVDLDLAPGRVTALVGESGAGKSVLLAALLGLLPRGASVTGTLRFDGYSFPLSDKVVLHREVRGRRIGLVPQSPATWLTPVRTVGSQLREAAGAGGAPGGSRRSRRRRAAEHSAAAAGRVDFPTELLGRYPHELSGGQLQRAALALALVGGAPLLLADEPTTGLDPELTTLALGQLRAEADAGRAVLIVTHDLASIEHVADEVLVLYRGRLVERVSARRFFAAPQHPYSAGLLDALPTRGFRPIPADVLAALDLSTVNRP